MFNNNNNECIICFKNLNYNNNNNNNNNNKNRTFITTCNHSFHLKCIDKWTKINNSCPTCRTRNIYANNLKKKLIYSSNYYSKNRYFNNEMDFVFI